MNTHRTITKKKRRKKNEKKIYCFHTVIMSPENTEKKTSSNVYEHMYKFGQNKHLINCSLSFYVLRLLLRCCFEAYNCSISLIIPCTKPSVFPATGWARKRNQCREKRMISIDLLYLFATNWSTISSSDWFGDDAGDAKWPSWKRWRTTDLIVAINSINVPETTMKQCTCKY